MLHDVVWVEKSFLPADAKYDDVHVPGCCCRRIQQLEARAAALEAKLDASASEAGQLIRRADRHETATATLQVGAHLTLCHHHLWAIVVELVPLRP
jgi:hypothetical protein